MTSTEENISYHGESELHIGAVFSLADTFDQTGIDDNSSANIMNDVPTKDTVAMVNNCQLDAKNSRTPEEQVLHKRDRKLNYTFPVKRCSVRLKNIINSEIKQKLLEIYKKNIYPELDDAVYVEETTLDNSDFKNDLDTLNQSRRRATRKRKVNSLLSEDEWLLPGAKIPRTEKVWCEIDHDLIMSVVQQIEEELEVSHDSHVGSIIPATLDVNINNTTVLIDWSTQIQHSEQQNMQSRINKLNLQIDREVKIHFANTKNRCIRSLNEWRNRIRYRMKVLKAVNRSNSIKTNDTVKVMKNISNNTEVTASNQPLLVPRVTSDTVRAQAHVTPVSKDTERDLGQTMGEVQPIALFKVANKTSVPGRIVKCNSASEILFGLSQAIREKRLNMEATSCKISNNVIEHVESPENKLTKELNSQFSDIKKALQKKLLNDCTDKSSECGIENVGIGIHQLECMRKDETVVSQSPENNIIVRDAKPEIIPNFDNSQSSDGTTESLKKDSEGNVAPQKNVRITTTTPADLLFYINSGTTEEISISDASTITRIAKTANANKFYQLIFDNVRVLIPSRNDTVLPKAFVMSCVNEQTMPTQAGSKVEETSSVNVSPSKGHTKQPFVLIYPLEKINSDFYQLKIGNKQVLIPMHNNTDLRKALIINSVDNQPVSAQAAGKSERGRSVKGGRQTKVHKKQPTVRGVSDINMNPEFSSTKLNIIPQSDMTYHMSSCSNMNQIQNIAADPVANLDSVQDKLKEVLPSVITETKQQATSRDFILTETEIPPVSEAQSTLSNSIQTKCPLSSSSVLTENSILIPSGFISTNNNVNGDSPIGYICSDTLLGGKLTLMPTVLNTTSTATLPQQSATYTLNTTNLATLPQQSVMLNMTSTATLPQQSATLNITSTVTLPQQSATLNMTSTATLPQQSATLNTTSLAILPQQSATLNTTSLAILPQQSATLNTTSTASLPQQSATYTSWSSLNDSTSVSSLPDITNIIPSIPLTVPVLQTFTQLPTMVPVNTCNSLGQIQYQLVPTLTPLPQLGTIAFLPINSGIVPTTSASVFTSPTESLLNPVLLSAAKESAASQTMTPSTNQFLTLTPSTNQISTLTPSTNQTSSVIGNMISSHILHQTDVTGAKSGKPSVIHTSSASDNKSSTPLVYHSSSVSTKPSSPTASDTSFVVGVESSSHSVHQTAVNGTNSRTLPSLNGTQSRTPILNQTSMASNNLCTIVHKTSVAVTKPSTLLVNRTSAVGRCLKPSSQLVNETSVVDTKPITPLVNITSVAGTKPSTPLISKIYVANTKPSTPLFVLIDTKSSSPSSDNQTSVDVAKLYTAALNKISAAGTKSSTPSGNKISVAGTKSSTPSVNQISVDVAKLYTAALNKISAAATKSSTPSGNKILVAGIKTSTPSVNQISAASTKSSTPFSNQISATGSNKSITTSVNQVSLAPIASCVQETETKAGLTIPYISDNSKGNVMQIDTPDITSSFTNVITTLQNNVSLGANVLPQTSLVSPSQSSSYITSAEQFITLSAKSASIDIVKSEPHNNSECDNIAYYRDCPSTGSETESGEEEVVEQAKIKTYIPETENHVPAGESRTEERIRLLKEKIRETQMQVENMRTNLLSKNK